jgi:hypothetical protein
VTVGGASSLLVNDPADGATTFDGVDDYVIVTSGTHNLAQATVAVWIQYASAPAASKFIGGFVIVNSRRERETMLRAVELAITEGTKEREAGRLERQELANRIQRPEATPVFSVPEGESQSITYDNDSEYWETKQQQNGDGS